MEPEEIGALRREALEAMEPPTVAAMRRWAQDQAIASAQRETAEVLAAMPDGTILAVGRRVFLRDSTEGLTPLRCWHEAGEERALTDALLAEIIEREAPSVMYRRGW